MDPAAAQDDRFLLPSDRQAAQEGRLPPEGAYADLPPAEVAARLSAGANDRFNDLVVAGWQDAAPALLAADTVAGRKRITWLVEPGHARRAAAALAAAPALQVRLVVVPDRGTVTVALERIGLGWSLAVLDPALVPPDELTLAGLNRFNRCRAGIERIHRDLAGLWRRIDRLDQALPLGALRGLHAGRAALCLAAGPSIGTHLERIRALAAECVVIAVDVVQKRLQAAGIPLDYVITVDSHGEVVGRMAASPDPRTTLVLPINGDARLDALFAQRAHFPAGGHLATRLLGSERFPTGTIVGTASVGLAHHLGCREVALFGHDLAYGEVMYSDLVDDGGALDAFNRAQIDQYRRVPGNGGGEVLTDYWFEVAIDDFRLLLAGLGDLRAYNPNIGTGTGARIDGTVDLPADWRPGTPFDRAAHDPAALPRLEPGLRDRQACAALLREHLAEFRRQWDDSRQPPEVTAEVLQHLDACRYADQVVGNLVMPGVIAATRQLSLPPSLGNGPYLEAAREHLRACLAGAEGFLDRLLGDGEPAVGPVWTGYARPDGAKALVRLLMASVSTPARPELAMLLSIECSYQGDLLAYGLSPVPPLPRSATEGLLILRRLADRLDDAWLAGVVGLCWLEGLDEPVRWAREQQALPEGWHPLDPADPAAGRPLAVDACQALAALRARAGAPPRELLPLARRACALPQARAVCVRDLLRGGAHDPQGAARVVADLAAEGLVELDDQLCATVLLHLDHPCAFEVVRPASAAYGEATILAMGQRIAATEPERALGYARRFRPLSRFHDQAVALEVECLARLGRHGEAARALAGCWDGASVAALAVPVHLAAGDHEAALAALAGRPCDEQFPGQAAQLAQAAIQGRDRRLLLGVMEAVMPHAATEPRLSQLVQALVTVARQAAAW